MTIEADVQFGGSLTACLGQLTAAVNGLNGRLDRERSLRQRAGEAFRQVEFIINVPIVSSAASINPSDSGPNLGYFWSIRRLAAVGFSAGSVALYIDNTGGEPLAAFPTAFPTVAPQTWGKGHLLIHPNSNIAVTATGITGTVQVWGAADQFEQWLLPWYMGTQRDG